jgi:hypothetical protein
MRSLRKYSQSLGQDLNLDPAKYKVVLLTQPPQLSIGF